MAKICIQLLTWLASAHLVLAGPIMLSSAHTEWWYSIGAGTHNAHIIGIETGYHELALDLDFTDESAFASLDLDGRFGDLPSVSVTAHVGTSGNTSAGASAFARVGYSMALVTTAPPPATPISVPIQFTANGDGTSDDGWAAIVRFLAGGSSMIWQADGSNPPFSVVTTLQLVPDYEYGVLLEAHCNIGTSGEFGGTKTCTAAADPAFSFDQASFDLMMGSNTFPLTAYYTIAYSPNLASPIPEPGTFALTISVLVITITVRSRGRGQRGASRPS